MKKLTIKQIAERAGSEIAVSVFGCADGHPWSQRFRKGWDTQRNAVAGKAAEVIENLLAEFSVVETAHQPEKFDDWWERDGKFYDPDFSNVPWFDKRKSLAEYAWHRSRQAHQSLTTILEQLRDCLTRQS